MSSVEITKDTYLQWYDSMLLLRKFEEKAGQLYGQQKIRGFCHLYIGQEAVVAGAISVLKPGDSMITAYRDHAHAIAKGMSPNEVMAELYGKATGCSKGKGGSMHMFSKEHKFFGGHGIVGGQIPLGAGIAFAEKYQGTDNVCVCYMGDGAVRQGSLNETFNMAMIWKLPVIFVCENNGYAMGTSVARTTNMQDIYKIGLGFDMPSEPVDGMDPVAVHNAMDAAVERARKGEGPSFLEIRTYRYKGHSMSDPAKYRTKEELERYKAKDPIGVVKHAIVQNGYADDEWFEEIDKKVKAIVDEAVKFAEESPWPDPSELYKDVYVQEDYPFIRS
ncbi:pyruvate dehydrogenase E1 component alpha subunit [Arcticibacter tournemirensis]|uniref:Pyruvate dehydrogenase E1 component subunit alpha n=1 Tax=Arcticibacter tournemirensis TaxID=699437 RepID=A0A4Q0MEK9_9SPHI|nr:pyruvate dehydrogenase (acetyl-transferring) E1 component subunit alpha [Arcticibacter tournemirensis]KAA8485444.1 pyruvate dehydrogenase (acetyl-transferring) E1 component subunit alpha [Arcticibacter tournemirensis]RXF71715.1 pyruvate dehydrogenase (acetyl-transferring) E1 component subunit alpha [Arcticibacter tournemirensis]TQM48854.1 pyruvate dehydrogenase E1 component alpha subunit [Arcticibacter tournemirensis]